MLPVKGGPFGGGYSTVEDLLRFDRALRSHILFRPSSTEMLLAGKVDLPEEPGARYAYGFRDERINGQRIVGHNGGFWGLTASWTCTWIATTQGPFSRTTARGPRISSRANCANC